MIEGQLVKDALKAPAGWEDTPEQAQLRECLIAILSGHTPVETINICYDLVGVMRDQLMTATANVRKAAALVGRETMTSKELSAATGQTPATIARLLTEAKAL